MRGTCYEGQTPVLTGELQQLRTALHVLRDSPGTLETEALRTSWHYPRSAKRDNREIEELRALVAALPESGQRRTLLNMPNLASILGHAGLIAFVLLGASHQISRSGLIPVPIEFVAKDSHQSKTLENPAEPKQKSRLDVSHAKPEVTPRVPLPNNSGSAGQTENLVSADQSESSISANSSAPAGSHEPSETYLWNANASSADTSGGLSVLVEQGTTASPELKVVRKTDWQGNPVEDNTLTYSAPGSGVRVIVREASSAGFLGTGFAPRLEPTDADTSGPFGPAAWDDNATAKSEKVDGTLVNLKDFGLTAFGYRSEVGYDFRSFGQNKNEFATPGTSTTKFGGEARLGAFAFGLAHSDVMKLDNLGPAFSPSDDNAIATVNEASLNFDLPHLFSGASGLTTKLIPTVWMTASDRQPADAKQSSTNSISFGGSWNWDYGNASLGYWNYYSNGDPGISTGWSGQGFDANLGAYYAAFGVDVSLSYGHSEDVSPGWQSAGALYNSTMTLSYTPNKLPGVWASASAGNYNQDALAYGSTSSDIYGFSTKGEYWSMAAGLDVTKLFWSPEAASVGDANGSIKLLYRYTDGLTVDSVSGKTSDNSSLVAVMLQRKF